MSPESHTQRHARTALVVGALTAALVAPLATWPATARADAATELQGVQQQIQEGNQAYEDATARVEELQGQIGDNEARIAELEATLPAQQERAEQSLRSLYKMQQGSGSLIDLLLSADDFYELLSTIQYLDVIQSSNSEAIAELEASMEELEQARFSLNSQMEEAEQEQQRAEEALEQANAARAELEAQIAAQAAAEEAERRAAIEAAQRAAEEAAARAAEQAQAEAEAQQEQQDVTFTTESGTEAPVEVPSSPDPGNVDWSSDKQAFVAEWSARIDAYLAGSPLAGQGTTFAEAAWEFGVDPRLSPAISMIESTQGRYCFLPHNAWGWGSSSWDSWEEAIWDHVEGLAIGYGGQLTYAGAQKYCPPNADFWYAGVLANMERI
ncbi:coiled-coil domain-containing protein [Olsenella uli]|uniref:coiled-coil domain-containing protein n=1 Tax=Olsenella uli TaxID=133926 RepID=UPI002570C0AE|nr:hypothetical protein [Olsenella uli]